MVRFKDLVFIQLVMNNLINCQMDGGESFNINRSGWPTIVDAIQKAGGLRLKLILKVLFKGIRVIRDLL